MARDKDGDNAMRRDGTDAHREQREMEVGTSKHAERERGK